MSVSDLHALTAPRLLVVETGKVDGIYSSFAEPFASDKQVARRSRVAYGAQSASFLHYLHYDVHHYHVGDLDPYSAVERYIHLPSETRPTVRFSLTWQTDPSTNVIAKSIFEIVASPQDARQSMLQLSADRLSPAAQLTRAF